MTGGMSALVLVDPSALFDPADHPSVGHNVTEVATKTMLLSQPDNIKLYRNVSKMQ